jgi:hypothetical protein
MVSVFSSHVSEVNYDAETSELYVTWDSGKTSVYAGVPPDVADGAQTSWSVGEFLHREVKPKYSHRYLGDK